MTSRPEPPGGEVLSSLPSTRPQRRSARRATGAKKAGGGAKPRAAEAKPAAGAKPPARKGKPATARARAKPKAKGRRPAAVRPSAATKAAGTQPRQPPPQAPQGVELVGTAIQAAGELAQLGLQLGTRAVAGAVRRIPRP
jgi:hypothetical protein